MSLRLWIPFVCLISAGACAVHNPLLDQYKGPNVFGTPFHDRDALLKEIPPGTPSDKAEAVLRSHGFQQWRMIRQGDRSALVYRESDVTRLRAGSGDTWVSLDLQRGIVRDVQLGRGPLESAAPGGVRAP